jgi:hypothetical protein
VARSPANDAALRMQVAREVEQGELVRRGQRQKLESTRSQRPVVCRRVDEMVPAELDVVGSESQRQAQEVSEP